MTAGSSMRQPRACGDWPADRRGSHAHLLDSTTLDGSDLRIAAPGSEAAALDRENGTSSRDGCGRSAGRPVADVMVTRPKTLPIDASVGDVRAVLEDDHVVMALLTEDGVLRGTLVRTDLPDDAASSAPALPWSSTAGRMAAPTDSAASVHQRLLESSQRRLAVVDTEGRLLGLVCLNGRRTGFCSDAGVAARASARRDTNASEASSR